MVVLGSGADSSYSNALRAGGARAGARMEASRAASPLQGAPSGHPQLGKWQSFCQESAGAEPRSLAQLASSLPRAISPVNQVKKRQDQRAQGTPTAFISQNVFVIYFSKVESSKQMSVSHVLLPIQK